jgi:septal ring factor EnvC (AmiA/AmiB activator)
MTDPAIISALIGGGVALVIGACQGGYVLYTRWSSRTQQARAAVKETVTAQDVANAALKAELKAANRLIGRQDRQIRQQAEDARQQDQTIQYLRDRLTDAERPR